MRTFSKIYGLSGLRAGYAVGSDVDLLAAVAPVLGVNALTQAAVEHALRTGDAEIDRRRAVSRERARITDELAALGADVKPLPGELRLVRAPGLSGDALAQALRRQGVIVAPGGPLGADDHVRAAVLDGAATDRLPRAYGTVTAEITFGEAGVDHELRAVRAPRARRGEQHVGVDDPPRPPSLLPASCISSGATLRHHRSHGRNPCGQRGCGRAPG